MDLIVGLPNETVDMVSNTLNEIANLKPCIPDNLTIHTMALKRASNLNQEFDSYHMTTEDEIEKMINMTMEFAYKIGMEPYYLYRQKNMIGNMENIGYAKPGKTCFYNVVMMDERQNILALGAGGVSKIIDFELDKLERVYNVKGMYDYISRIKEMLQRKDEFFKKY
jgi:oxygen-independent coproporphyrinogen-3 oxidase